MTKFYREIVKARLTVNGNDVKFHVRFEEEILAGKAWEINPMIVWKFEPGSKEIYQYKRKRTDNIRICFFPEDPYDDSWSYVLSGKDAKTLWKVLHSRISFYWARELARNANFELVCKESYKI